MVERGDVDVVVVFQVSRAALDDEERVEIVWREGVEFPPPRYPKPRKSRKPKPV